MPNGVHDVNSGQRTRSAGGSTTGFHWKPLAWAPEAPLATWTSSLETSTTASSEVVFPFMLCCNRLRSTRDMHQSTSATTSSRMERMLPIRRARLSSLRPENRDARTINGLFFFMGVTEQRDLMRGGKRAGVNVQGFDTGHGRPHGKHQRR